MGRIQGFERTVVVQAARDLFWDRGYEAASLADLEQATGVGRSSLYHAFGNKRGLFDAAVDDYLDTVIRPRLGVLTDGVPGAPALLAYFGELRMTVASLSERSPRRGCLLVNCAVGLAGHDDLVRQIVDAYRTELAVALRASLLAASAGSDAPGTRLDERTRTLSSLSLSAMLLARVNRDESLALLDSAGDQIRSWFPDHPAD